MRCHASLRDDDAFAADFADAELYIAREMLRRSLARFAPILPPCVMPSRLSHIHARDAAAFRQHYASIFHFSSPLLPLPPLTLCCRASCLPIDGHADAALLLILPPIDYFDAAIAPRFHAAHGYAMPPCCYCRDAVYAADYSSRLQRVALLFSDAAADIARFAARRIRFSMLMLPMLFSCCWLAYCYEAI